MNEREKNKENRYKEILRTGLDLIVENGYEAFKIRDLAAKLNISVGLFFHYFKSKEDLYKKLIEIGSGDPMKLINEFIDDKNPLDIFTKMADYIFDAISRDSFTSRMFVLMHQASLDKSIPDSVKVLISNFDMVSPLIPVVRRGQEAGMIKSGDPATLIIAYWSAINGVAELYDRGKCQELPKGYWMSDILREHNN